MLPAISTQVFLPHRLTPAHLDALAASGAQAIELFAARHHFDYSSRTHMRELAQWFRSNEVTPLLHAPLSSEPDFSRHAEPNIDLLDREKSRRILAMEELKRALESAEHIPSATCVLHLGHNLTGVPWSEHTLDIALTAVEHLKAFAAPLGVRLLLENLPNPIATPEHLLDILRIGHFDTTGICLDVAHLHLSGIGTPDADLPATFELLRPHLVELHLSDNDGRSDTHLWPPSGSERPASLSGGTIDWPAFYALAATLPAHTPGVLEIADTQAPDPAFVTRLAREVFSHQSRLLEPTS